MEFPGFFVCPECKPIAVAKLARGEMIGTIWRKGKSLVMRRDAVFPDCCVYCNDSANGYRLKRTYYWHHPALYLLILTPFAPLILYFIVSVLTRKSVTVAVPLCRRHHRRLVLKRLIALGIFMASLAFLAAGINFTSGVLAVLALATFVGALVGAGFADRVLAATRIDETQVVFSGTGSAFREEFPEWPHQ